jgi:hypothetical protein
VRFRQIIGDPNYDPAVSEECLPSLDDAVKVHALLDRPEDYELVLLERDLSGPGSSVLGYDVGYWASHHFSLICDTLVMPLWHPPQPEDFGELAELARRLNAHLLFPAAYAAAAFREWYVGKAGAETESEPGQFCVMRVSSPITAR